MDPSTCIPMDSLPNKALNKIFINCTSKDLLSLTITCKKFNHIISNNRQLLDYFLVKFNRHKIGNEWIGSRTYYHIYVDGAYAHNFIDIIEKIGSTIVGFASNANGMKVSVLRKILMTLKDVKAISIGELKDDELEFDEKDFNEPLPRFNLRSLEYQGSSRNFGLFTKCQTKKLMIEREKSENDDNFREMLKAQISLEELHLGNFLENSSLLDDNFEDIKFKLKRLYLWFFEAFEHQNFHKFLNPHEKTLEYLDLIWHGEMLKHFEKFTNLTEVKMKACNIENFVIESVKDLWVENVSKNIEKCFPNIKTLWITEHIDDWTFFKQLRDLKVVIIENCRMDEIDVPQIDKLVLMDTKFDEKPFKFEGCKISNLVIERCSTKWLTSYLELITTEMFILKLKDVKIDWRLKWALKGFEYKISNLKLINVGEVDEYESESESESEELIDDDEDGENSSDNLHSSEENHSDNEKPEEIIKNPWFFPQSSTEPVIQENFEAFKQFKFIDSSIPQVWNFPSLNLTKPTNQFQPAVQPPKVLEYNPQTIAELAEDLSKVEAINNDVYKVIQSLNNDYLKGDESDSEESVTSIGRQKFCGFLDIGVPMEVLQQKLNENKKKEAEVKDYSEITKDDKNSSNEYQKVKQLNFDIKKFKNPPKAPSKHLNEFPEEVLIEIFKYLSFKDRIALSETCHRFFDITSNSQFINGFKLKLKDKEIIDGLRDYQKVSVIQYSEFFEPLFDRIGKSIRELIIVEVNLKASTIVKIIKKSSNLKHLRILCCNPIIDKFEDLEISLETFKLKSSMEFLGVFQKVRTREFEFTICSEMAADSLDLTKESLVDFLLHQNELKSLALEGDHSEALSIPKFSLDRRLLEVQFRLEHLKICDIFYSSNSAIFDFVNLHKDSLKSISVNLKTTQFLKTVSDFPNLKKVKLDHVSLLDEISIELVEELEINYCAGKILETFPNLKKLEVDDTQFSTLKQVKTLKRLEELEISSMHFHKMLSLPKSVKKLSLLMTSDHLKCPFRMSGHQIEELNVGFCSKLDWIWRFLIRAEKKVKINLDGVEISLKVQKAFEMFKDKIEELKMRKCTFEENSNIIEVEFSEDEEEEEEDNSESDSEDDENFFEPIDLDYENYDPEVQYIAMNVMRYFVNNQRDSDLEEDLIDEHEFYF